MKADSRCGKEAEVSGRGLDSDAADSELVIEFDCNPDGMDSGLAESACESESLTELENPEAGSPGEVQIDPETDPLTQETATGPTPQWEHEMRKIQPRKIEVPSPDSQVSRLRSILTQMESEPSEPSNELVRESLELVRNLKGRVPDCENFVAGSFQRYLPAWRELLQDSKRKSARTVLSWLKTGFRPKFEGTQNAKPDKMRVVRAMLTKTVGGRDVGQFLTGRRPHRIEFPNHRSFYDRWEFSEGEIRENLKSGAVGIWPEGGEPPEVISPMGVVESAGKERLICNDRYVNAFLKQYPFQYEKLRDVLAFTGQGFFMATADLKSGYFHVPIHPAFWKFFAFRVGSTVFFYRVLCFGFAQACFVFTKVMREPLLEFRSRGIPLSGYIDDTFTAARTFGRALRQILLVVLGFGAIGAFFGLPKCELEPLLQLKWLGVHG